MLLVRATRSSAPIVALALILAALVVADIATTTIGLRMGATEGVSQTQTMLTVGGVALWALVRLGETCGVICVGLLVWQRLHDPRFAVLRLELLAVMTAYCVKSFPPVAGNIAVIAAYLH